VKSLLSDKYPNLKVVGTNYPVHPTKAILSKALMTVQMGLLGVVIGGEQVLGAVGITMPDAMVARLKDNKFGIGMGIWVVGNLVVSSLGNTGAFEISYDGQMVFSKLDSGRMPSVQEIFSGIEAIKRNH